jgi:excisionase family DNA binding protein
MASLTPQDVADELKVENVEAVVRMLRTGALPGFKVGRRWRVDPTELAEWKANRAPRPGDPNRIAPRSPRSQAAIERRRTA